MKQVEIEVRIDKQGKVTTHVEGMKGKGCDEVIAAFEKGGELVEKGHTSAFYEKPEESIVVGRGKG